MFALPALLLAATLADAPPSIVFPGETWTRAEPAAVGVDPAALADALAYLETVVGRDGVGQTVLIRYGRLVHAGDDHRAVHPVWSCTKSFTTTCLGLLIADGITTLDTPAANFAPSLSGRYGGATFRHFASMTSGYRAVGDWPRPGPYRHGGSRTPWLPDPDPLFSPPGSKYSYWDSAQNVYGLALTLAAGEPLEELFMRRVGSKIGVDPARFDWRTVGETNGGVTLNGGSGNMDGYVVTDAPTLARLGHLYLNGGNWDGERLLPAEFVREATAVQVPARTPLGSDLSPFDGRGQYGLNWWVNGVTPTGERRWPSLPAGTFSASGYNNNDLFVVPAWGLVFVRLGEDQADHMTTERDYDGFFARLRPGLRWAD